MKSKHKRGVHVTKAVCRIQCIITEDIDNRKTNR